MGCSKTKKGGGKRRLVLAISAAALLGGCSASDLAQLESPYVVAGVATASREGCLRAALEDRDKAEVASRVLAGVIPQLEACQQGLEAGLLMDPNAD